MRILKAVARAAGLTVYLQKPGSGSPSLARACAAAKNADRSIRGACKKRRAAVIKRASKSGRVAGAMCPIGGYCLARPVYANGIEIATIKAGGFVRFSATDPRYSAVRTLLDMAAEEVGARAASLFVRLKGETAPIDRAYEFLRAHASERLTIQNISDNVGIGRQHLEKIWRKTFGDSVAVSLAKLRVENARFILSNPDGQRKKMVDVAFDAGFGSVSQFNRTFLKYAGIAPREFSRNPPDH